MYAGILGPLAMLTVLAQGLMHAKEADSVLFHAWCSLMVFSVVGAVIGWIAGWAVEESVNATIQAELDEEGSSVRPESLSPSG